MGHTHARLVTPLQWLLKSIPLHLQRLYTYAVAARNFGIDGISKGALKRPLTVNSPLDQSKVRLSSCRHNSVASPLKGDRCQPKKQWMDVIHRHAQGLCNLL